jgi:metal-responsive CopG/Arc/MetJ family transcriptional regulator
MIRFDAELLARVDRAARRRGVSRSAWVAFTLSKALDEEEQA